MVLIYWCISKFLAPTSQRRGAWQGLVAVGGAPSRPHHCQSSTVNTRVSHRAAAGRGGRTHLFLHYQRQAVHTTSMNQLAVFLLLAVASTMVDGDMMRKSIVFDKATPDVFYCPVDKPTSFEKMLVHSRPLAKLCEFDGNGLPGDYKSDCYNDVDESEYACKEKKRIMIRQETEEVEREMLQATTRAANNKV